MGPVHKCLAAAAEICGQGNRIVLDDDGSFIMNKRTGETTPIHKKGNTYIIRVRVLRPEAVKPAPKSLAAVGDADMAPASSTSGKSPVFRRPAQP